MLAPKWSPVSAVPGTPEVFWVISLGVPGASTAVIEPAPRFPLTASPGAPM
jgi:hypothetical protein